MTVPWSVSYWLHMVAIGEGVEGNTRSYETEVANNQGQNIGQRSPHAGQQF